MRKKKDQSKELESEEISRIVSNKKEQPIVEDYSQAYSIKTRKTGSVLKMPKEIQMDEEL